MTLKGERGKDIFSINGTFLKKTYSNVFTLGLLDQKNRDPLLSFGNIACSVKTYQTISLIKTTREAETKEWKNERRIF